jgi:hypothetical protein
MYVILSQEWIVSLNIFTLISLFLSGLSGSVDIVSFLFLVFFSEGRNAKHLQQRQIRGSQGGRVPHACPQGVKVPGNGTQSFIPVLRIRYPVPFWPLVPGWVKNQDPSGSGIRSGMNIPDYIYESLEKMFGLKCLNSLLRIRDGKNSDPG